jgi:hypothetical protein
MCDRTIFFIPRTVSGKKKLAFYDAFAPPLFLKMPAYGFKQIVKRDQPEEFPAGALHLEELLGCALAGLLSGSR